MGIASYTVSQCAPHVANLHAITASFEGFISNPRNIDTRQFAAALAMAA